LGVPAKLAHEPTLIMCGYGNPIDNFFDEVERVLREHGIPFETVEVSEGNER
jgi:4-aminobutyrate aminotransferase-like enzyme